MWEWKLFLDHVTDTEDALQRMVALCHEAGETDVALAATTAAAGLRALERVMVQRGSTLPVPKDMLC